MDVQHEDKAIREAAKRFVVAHRRYFARSRSKLASEQTAPACPPIADLLLASEGELPPVRLRSIRCHAADCADCQEELRILDEMAGRSSHHAEQRERRLSDERRARFLAKLEARKASRRQGDGRPTWFRRIPLVTMLRRHLCGYPWFAARLKL